MNLRDPSSPSVPRWRAWLFVLTFSLVAVSASAGAQSFVQLKNRWKPDQYVHIENGPPTAGPIQPGWWSAMWVMENVPGANFVRLRNRWKPDQYLHIEPGRLDAGPIQPG
ncbi:MAG: hypothetical protein MUF30_14070, partial [Burkholderiales bacterium]|nr:hypothetical protein [Burkholderiales bacterium]